RADRSAAVVARPLDLGRREDGDRHSRFGGDRPRCASTHAAGFTARERTGVAADIEAIGDHSVTIELAFAGFFECRLATDPDPFDELRGTSGWTFALPGEPNLDRIIRFQPTGAVLRWGGPAVGVAV